MLHRQDGKQLAEFKSDVSWKVHTECGIWSSWKYTNESQRYFFLFLELHLGSLDFIMLNIIFSIINASNAFPIIYIIRRTPRVQYQKHVYYFFCLSVDMRSRNSMQQNIQENMNNYNSTLLFLQIQWRETDNRLRNNDLNTDHRIHQLTHCQPFIYSPAFIFLLWAEAYL